MKSSENTSPKNHPTADPPTCAYCNGFMPPPKGRGRPRKFCSDACRQQDYEDRTGKPHFKQQQTEREADRDLRRRTWRTQRDYARRIEAIEEEWDHQRHREKLECAHTVIRSEQALASVLEFVSYLILLDDVSEWAEGVHLGRILQQLLQDARLMGFRVDDGMYRRPENWPSDEDQRQHAKRSKVIAELRAYDRAKWPRPVDRKAVEPSVHSPSLSTLSADARCLAEFNAPKWTTKS